MKRFLGIILILGAMVTPAMARSSAVVVFAAASLTDCLNELASKYTRQTGQEVVFNFASSSALARQIQEGAPADVFVSSDEAKMDGLEKRGLIEAGTRKTRLSNLLAIIVGAGSPLKIQSPFDLTNSEIRRVALGDPQTVPAGIYAREYFIKLGLWARIEHRVVPTENVRAALAAVESGNVEAGVVYKTDAAISKSVKVAYLVSRSEGPSISYPMAAIKGARHLGQAKKFLEFLDSMEAAAVFEKFGFIVQN